MHSSTTARRRLLRTLAAAAVAPIGLAVARAAQAAAPVTIQLWKSPTCGCCGEWIKHVEAAGFKVNVTEVPNTNEIRARLGMPAKLGSCHTGIVGGYVLEGHVPAREIKRLLAEKPKALGITVPGMPIGSPGMDGPVYMGEKDPYDVLLVQADGSTRVFASYHKTR